MRDRISIPATGTTLASIRIYILTVVGVGDRDDTVKSVGKVMEKAKP